MPSIYRRAFFLAGSRRNKGKQVEGGRIDAGTRSEVTGGTQMGALEVLVADVLAEAGSKRADVKT